MLFGKRDPFYAYERAILEAAVHAAPPPLVETLRAQLQQIRHVQRSRAAPEINFYAARRGGGWDQNWLFANRGDIRFATVVVLIDGQSHRGSLYAVSGHLFSLVLRPAVADPKRAMPEEIQVEPTNFSSLLDPDASQRLDVAPPSFLEAERLSANQNANRWAVLEPRNLYIVALPLADWAVLAQAPDGHLLLGRRSETGESFCVANVEDNVVRPLAATTWAEALLEANEGAS